MIRIGRVIGFFIFDNPWWALRDQARRNTLARYRSFELLICILIIGILSVIAINIFTGYKHKAILLHSFGKAAQTIREQSQIYFSLTGAWPENTDRLEQETGLSREDITPEYNSYVAAVELDHGAVSVTFAKDLKGQILTLRPAVPKGDPLGPVIWVAGRGTGREDWILAGEDKTTVDTRIINSTME